MERDKFSWNIWLYIYIDHVVLIFVSAAKMNHSYNTVHRTPVQYKVEARSDISLNIFCLSIKQLK